MDNYIEYRSKLFNVLNSLRQSNGVFRASSSNEYNATWLRDNFWVNSAYLGYNNEKYLQTCHTHLDFLHKWENDYDHKIKWLVKDNNVYSQPSRFIHPKVNFDGSEIDKLNWQFLQVDTFAYIILMIYNGFNNGMKVFRTDEDRFVFQILIDALQSIDFYNKDLAHSWEEELGCFTSNLGLCIRALEVSYDMGFEVKHDVIKKARLKFYEQFPYERTGRDWDLTLLFLCVVDGILKPVDIEEVLKGIHLHLERDYGIIRYIDDIYKPFTNTKCDTEMEWQMGFGFLGLIYGRLGNKTMCKYYIDRLINQYPDGIIPEGTNNNGECCNNTPLAWSEAMTILAINEYIKL